ncbi:MAG TPA: hypothetical protein VHY31_08120 [Streptosporangiaceae bacterium]|nr:hypothetical protein [Streptosporangiaceae bacterium]
MSIRPAGLAYHPEATRTARGIAGDSTQAMSWFSVGGTAGLALGPPVVTPVLLVTGLAGTPRRTAVVARQDHGRAQRPLPPRSATSPRA